MYSSDLIDDDEFYCCKRLGRSHLICGKKNTKFPQQCFVGPDWFCMTVTYVLIIGLSVLFIHNIALLWGSPIVAVTVLLAAVALTFFSLTACSDPGIVLVPKHQLANDELVEEPSGGGLVSSSGQASSRTVQPRCPPVQEQLLATTCENGVVVGAEAAGGSSMGSDANLIGDLEAGNKAEDSSRQSSAMVIPPPRSRRVLNTCTPPTYECGRCNINRPQNSAHCHDCGFCITSLDHHCPWTGKCIGKKTLQTFYFFLWSVGLLIVWVVVLFVITIISGRKFYSF
jgi:hypothetical protein